MGMLWSALGLGFAGSLHCAAMCGPIILSVSHGSSTPWKMFIYHAGRILSYLLLGIAFGFAGRALHLVIYQQYISIISGVLILLMLLARLYPSAFKKISFIYPLWQKIRNFILPALKSKPAPVLKLGLGMLNGLLPCGLVYIAASASMSMNSVAGSLLYMMLFGLGTVPMLVGIGLSGRLITLKHRVVLNKMMPAMLLTLSLLFVVRGLSLNIPYLSPKISNNGNKIESCCHKR